MSDTGLKSIAAKNKETDTKSGLAAVIRNLNEVSLGAASSLQYWNCDDQPTWTLQVNRYQEENTASDY
ncbi:hypothetical protein GQ600_1153 [Phytophthora cactorum]|nr:hypothetical protein GQ600_1153 [Phytophthora cactorum]